MKSLVARVVTYAIERPSGAASERLSGDQLSEPGTTALTVCAALPLHRATQIPALVTCVYSGERREKSSVSAAQDARAQRLVGVRAGLGGVEADLPVGLGVVGERPRKFS
jgi:hypothetical protein